MKQPHVARATCLFAVPRVLILPRALLLHLHVGHVGPCGDLNNSDLDNSDSSASACNPWVYPAHGACNGAGVPAFSHLASAVEWCALAARELVASSLWFAAAVRSSWGARALRAVQLAGEGAVDSLPARGGSSSAPG